MFDRTKIRGELAESYEVSPDGLKITFKLRDAKWHDGTPVTADDVKWSLDRAVSAKSLSKGQLGTGSLTTPDQFVVVDARTMTVTLPKPDRLALSNLATPLAPIFNSKLAKQHATAGRSLGSGMAEDQYGRQRRLHDRDLQAGRASDAAAERRLEERS